MKTRMLLLAILASLVGAGCEGDGAVRREGLPMQGATHAGRHWGGQRLVGPAAYDAEPRLAVDPQGTAALVWHQDLEHGESQLVMTTVDMRSGVARGSGLIDRPKVVDARAPDVVKDTRGGWIVAWSEHREGRAAVCLRAVDARRRDAPQAQCLPVSDEGAGLAPRLAVGPAGDVAVVWREGAAVMASRMGRDALSWSTPERVGGMEGRVGEPQAAIDHVGNIIAVWEQSGFGRRTRVFASRFDAAAGRWANAQRVNETSDTDQFSPHVGFSRAGEAMALWVQRSGDIQTPFASRYDQGLQRFATAVPLETQGGHSGPADIGFDAEGNGVAVWAREADSAFSIRVRRFETTSDGWSKPETVAEGRAFSIRPPRIGTSADGNCIVVWSQLPDAVSEHLFAVRFVAARDQWQPPVQIGAQARGWGATARLAVGPKGDALAVWAGHRVLRANTYR